MPILQEDGSSPVAWGAGGCNLRCNLSVPVHPQSPGERPTSMNASPPSAGSSPVAWGAAPRSYRRQPARRFIPSRLGSGRSARTKPGSSTGSSPVAWGAVEEEGLERAPSRFIPSRLGSGAVPVEPAPNATVHPQSPGERTRPAGRSGQPRGSSPVAWGAASGARTRTGGPRFIPSRLGSGPSQEEMDHILTVHPQSPGERSRSSPKIARTVGSSPVAWGAVISRRLVAVTGRFIPSRLGSGSGAASTSARKSVHPQSPGERAPRRISSAADGGSSPVAWGAAGALAFAARLRRFIPSRLGSG